MRIEVDYSMVEKVSFWNQIIEWGFLQENWSYVLTKSRNTIFLQLRLLNWHFKQLKQKSKNRKHIHCSPILTKIRLHILYIMMFIFLSTLRPSMVSIISLIISSLSCCLKFSKLLFYPRKISTLIKTVIPQFQNMWRILM